MMPLTGTERLRLVKTKVRIQAVRNLRRYLSGEIDIMPESGFERAIAAEFDRLTQSRIDAPPPAEEPSHG